MSNQIIDVISRSADQIAVEICTIREQVATTAMVGACQIGKRLEELKTLVPFGEWGDFIKHRIGYSQRQCDNLMQLYREFGELGPKSKSIANLSPTAALKLLALPADEREAFAEEHDAANLSVRKLEQKIKELTIQKEAADAASAAAMERITAAQAMQKAVEDRNAQLQSRIDGLKEELRKQAEVKPKTPDIAANPNYGAFKAAFEALVPAFQQVCKYAVAAADSDEQATVNRNAIKGLLLKLAGVADREVVWDGT